MRFHMLFLAALCFTAAATADDLCGKTAQAAREIMKARQDGVPIDVMIGAAEKQSDGFDELTRQLVLSAYEVERRFSRSSIERETVEFGNQAYLTCMKAQ